MSEISFSLSEQEARTVIGVLGDQPTRLGVFPALQRLVDQYNAEMEARAASNSHLEAAGREMAGLPPAEGNA